MLDKKCFVPVTKYDRSWTPLHIHLMIHYYASCEPFERPDASSTIQYTKDLIENGLIVKSKTSGSGYTATEKGCAFVDKICKTSPPKQIWA